MTSLYNYSSLEMRKWRSIS